MQECHKGQRTWAEVNLDHLVHNLQVIRKMLPEKTQVLAVVKADAYGHGDRHVAAELEKQGVGFFGVSNLDEAVALRAAGIRGEILIFGYTPAASCRVLADQRITQAVYSLSYARALSREAALAGCRVQVHNKLDTGMGRIGFACAGGTACIEELRTVYQLPGLQVTGTFTHLSHSDSRDDDAQAFTQQQRALFMAAVAALQKEGLDTGVLHIQNSAGILLHPDWNYDMARAGIILYGQNPAPECAGMADLRPVLELKSCVSMVKTVAEGTPISYGRTTVTTRETRVATIPVGYADGYPRILSRRASVLISGRRAPILGNICMDQMMVDVTDIPGVQEGDLVTLFGTDGPETITLDELAELAGTISYELTCMLSLRVPRVYIRNGQVVGQVQYNNPQALLASEVTDGSRLRR